MSTAAFITAEEPPGRSRCRVKRGGGALGARYAYDTPAGVGEEGIMADVLWMRPKAEDRDEDDDPCDAGMPLSCLTYV